MAKKNKNQNVSYDREAMQTIANEIRELRKPLKDGSITELAIDMFAFERTIKGLPTKARESLEKFWGLIPGTIKRNRNYEARMKHDISVARMAEEAYTTLDQLTSLEYLYFFDANARKLVKNYITKIDKTSYETMSDMDVINYLFIFLVFFVGGTSMNYDVEESKLSCDEEIAGRFDKYSLLNAAWEGKGYELPEHSIKLGLLVEIIEMFDLRDVIAMKRYVGLPISSEYSSIQIEELESFWQIRKFKEKIFSYGAWNATAALIYNQGVSKINLKTFEQNLNSLRSDWSNISKFEVSSTTVKTMEGEKQVKVYKIGGLEFTDIFEVMSLYICRKYL